MKTKGAMTEKDIEKAKYRASDPFLWDRQKFKDGSFGIKVSRSGVKTFVLSYLTETTRTRRWLPLGSYPAMTLDDARKKATELMGEVYDGKDPAEERREVAKADTVKDLWVSYLENYAKPNKKSWRYDQDVAERDFIPAFGSRKISEVTKKDVAQLIQKVASRTKKIGGKKGEKAKKASKDANKGVLANRLLWLIGAVFIYGMKNGLCDTNPAADIPKPRKEKSRDRFLEPEEVKAIWAAAEKEHALVAANFKIRLYTGQRGVEVRSMRWSDIDFAKRVWTIPKEVSKNKKPHEVPLAPQVVALLEDLRVLTGQGVHVFPGRTGKNRPGDSAPAGPPAKALARIRETSKVEFNPHDLRRTVATSMTKHLKQPSFIVGKVLNHTHRSTITDVYDRHDYLQEKRIALVLWANFLEALVTGKEVEKVVEFPATATA